MIIATIATIIQTAIKTYHYIKVQFTKSRRETVQAHVLTTLVKKVEQSVTQLFYLMVWIASEFRRNLRSRVRCFVTTRVTPNFLIFLPFVYKLHT